MIKLTPADVTAILAAHAAGETTMSLANRYGCSKGGIQHHISKARGKVKTRTPTPTKYHGTCGLCDEEFTASRRRTYCTRTCTQLVRQQEKLAEFKWIAGTDSWDNIAARLGFVSRQALVAWLRARDQPAWADRINLDAHAEREPQKRWAA